MMVLIAAITKYVCYLNLKTSHTGWGCSWVQGSRQFKDFDEYLVTADKFNQLKQSNELPLTITTDCDLYLQSRLSLLEQKLAIINRMAATNDLPDAMINQSGLKITPLDAVAPDTAQTLIDQTAMLITTYQDHRIINGGR